MKLLGTAVLLLTTSMAWANPLLLKCTVNKKLVVLNVEGLTGQGCHSGNYNVMNGQLKSRYNVTLCNSTSAEGTIEVQTNQGQWFEVNEFSTEGGSANHCYLYREIETTRPCPRHSHQC